MLHPSVIAEKPDEDACAHALDVIGQVGSKWTMLVLGRLRAGPLHFGELQRASYDAARG